MIPRIKKLYTQLSTARIFSLYSRIFGLVGAIIIASGATLFVAPSQALAATDAKDWTCYNFGAPGAGLCQFNSDGSGLSLDGYQFYGGYYPDTSNLLDTNTGSFTPSNFAINYHNFPFWMDFHNGSTHYYYQSDGTQNIDGSSTHFISVVPSMDSSTSTPRVFFSASWFVSNDDLTTLNNALFGSSLRLVGQIQDPIKSSWNCVVLDKKYTGVDLTVDTATTTVAFPSGNCGYLINNHDYKVSWTLVGTKYFNLFGDPTFSISTTTYFTFGSTTHNGAVSNWVNSVLASSTTSGFGARVYTFEECSLGSFDLGLCLADVATGMFSPDPEVVNRFVELKDDILTRAPIGYVTLFVDLLSTTTVATLPVIDYTFASTSALHGETIYLDPFAYAATSTIGSIHSDGANGLPQEGVWDIVGGIISTGIYLTLAFMILHDLTNVFGHASQHKSV